LRGEEEEELEAGELEKDMGLWLLRAFPGELYINELESRWQSQKRCSKIHVRFYIGSDLKSANPLMRTVMQMDDTSSEDGDSEMETSSSASSLASGEDVETELDTGDDGYDSL
jgi:hypothetical protein